MYMTPKEIKEVLKDLGAEPNKRLGQHFLIDPHVLETIVQTAEPAKIGISFEIGPGLGVLTRALLQQGHHIIALERDTRFIQYLKNSIQHENFKLITGDATDIDWSKYLKNSWSLISNLPYAISSFALRTALYNPNPAAHIVVLVQREVGERAISVAGEMKHSKHENKTSLLSLMVALASSHARIVKRVSQQAFYPAPKVESVVLEIIPMSHKEREKKWGIQPEKIMHIAKTGFAHPRKKLSSNLTAGLGLSKEFIADAFTRTQLNQNIRAEDVSPRDWAMLASCLDESVKIL